MSSYVVRFALVGLVVAAAGCNKVSQDQFDQSMAQMQAELDDQRSGIEANASGIEGIQAELDALEAELEELADEYQAMVERHEDHIRFVTPINFDFDSSEIRASDQPFLDRFAMVINQHYAGSMVTVQGFTDPAGPAEYNKWLSSQRAETVADYLIGSAGMDAGSVRSVGLGENHPVAPGEWGDSDGGMKNRRVTFVVESAGR